MKLSQPTPELPVPNVRLAQEYYRDVLGFEIAWHNEEGKIGAVSLDECAIFFRQIDGDIAHGTFWLYCEDIDEAHAEFVRREADIIEKPEDKPWGLRQFTIQDHCKNRFYFFREI